MRYEKRLGALGMFGAFPGLVIWACMCAGPAVASAIKHSAAATAITFMLSYARRTVNGFGLTGIWPRKKPIIHSPTVARV